MTFSIILFLIGLVFIIKGGDIFVDAATWGAEKTGIPKLIVGATVISLATTLPEMLVSFFAAQSGMVDMAIGNAIGSVTVNIGIIMGISLVFMPTIIQRKDYLNKSIIMLLAAFILLVFGFTGNVGLLPNLILVGIFVFSMADNIRHAKIALSTSTTMASTIEIDVAPSVSKEVPLNARKEIFINLAKFLLGAVAIVAGSQLLVDNGGKIALAFGVPERIIALTLMSIGTSLPELVTAISAISKKQGALSVGNILGANTIALTLLLPITSLVAGKPLPISSQFARIDLPVCFIISCVALVPSLITQKFHRVQGFVLIAIYLLYLVVTMVLL